MQFFVERGIDNDLYRACYILAFLTIFIFNGFYGKKYQIKPVKSTVFSIVSYCVIYLWAYILAWVANGFQWGHHNAIRVYIWMPAVLWLMGKLFQIEWKKACDYITPSTCIVYGIARLGCLFPGCCYGIPTRIGIYSCSAGHVCFPVQLCESVTALLIAAVILVIAGKRKYKVVGDLYPMMLVMYGAGRFVWEFFADNTKIIFGMSELAIWALATFVLGAIWLILFHTKDQNKTRDKREKQ